MGTESAFTIILIAGAAFLLPLIAGRLALPAVVLEIIFGIVIGPSGLGVIGHSALLDFLAEFGLFLLMFLSGFEIDFGRLSRQSVARTVNALLIFTLTLLLSYLASNRLGYGAFVTFLLATTSMGLVVPVLRGTHRARTTLGQMVLVSAAMADFLTMLGVTVFAVIYEVGVGWSLVKIPILFGTIALVLLLLRLAVWWYPEKFERLFSSNDPDEMGIRTTLALMFVFIGLSLALDVEPILGAFLAGAVFALVFRHRGGLERTLKGFSYGFLIPVFFINVGVRFDLGALALPGRIEAALWLIGVAVAVKLIPSLLLLFNRIGPREVFAAGFLLSARLSLVIAIAALGLRLNLLDSGMQASVILLALATSILSPTLFRLLAPPLPATEDKD